MKTERVIVRTTNNLSYVGKVVATNINEDRGVFIQPSYNSGIKIWCPLQEIESIIEANGQVRKGEEYINVGL
ncbi:hypothetical protein SH1V18_46410 [Vallitalea longa]|uniref:Uncharacterized protein n=1 Tax=Vallitalea longa TaxID=2936439 RepID=A0A9W6DGC3_9FIRM|nr:hypothetical protein [Vallitalea longa]GKX32161.1 hypothetical protein SH1V18_46410 [Vallitalea longa]